MAVRSFHVTSLLVVDLYNAAKATPSHKMSKERVSPMKYARTCHCHPQQGMTVWIVIRVWEASTPDQRGIKIECLNPEELKEEKNNVGKSSRKG